MIYLGLIIVGSVKSATDPCRRKFEGLDFVYVLTWEKNLQKKNAQ